MRRLRSHLERRESSWHQAGRLSSQAQPRSHGSIELADVYVQFLREEASEPILILLSVGGECGRWQRHCKSDRVGDLT